MTPRACYALFMALALVTAMVVRHFIPKPSLPRWKRALLAMAAFVGGVLGAKLPFVLTGQESWFSGAAWLTDGKTIMAGMAGAYLLVELAKLGLGIRAKTGDSFALPLALAMSVGRWGCFFNGCCAGTPTSLPWGVRFSDGVPRHPTQIYEVAFHLIMAAMLFVLLRRRLWPRQHLKLYLIGYAVFRFSIEFIRVEPSWWLGLSVYQWAAVAMIPPLLVQAWFDRKNNLLEPGSESLESPPRAAVR
jgi:prolipoprotein diacylglyceryltransferase